VNGDSPPDDAYADEPVVEDTEEWWEKHPHETVRAVPLTESTSGIDATVVDLSHIDFAPMLLLRAHYPLEDGVDDPGEIAVHGTGEMLELAESILALCATLHDVPGMSDDVLEDDEWAEKTDHSGGEG